MKSNISVRAKRKFDLKSQECFQVTEEQQVDIFRKNK